MRNYIYILPTSALSSVSLTLVSFINGRMVILLSSLILMVDKITDLLDLKADLSERFRMKDLGKLSYCLGLSVM